MTLQDSPEARIARYDLVTNYRAGSSIEEMERNDDDGEWVRWEDVEGRLHEQAQEIERVKSLLDDLTNVEMIQRLKMRAEAAESALAAARMALERTTAMCRAATTWAPDDTQGLRYHALEAAKDGMAALAELTQGHTSPGRDTA